MSASRTALEVTDRPPPDPVAGSLLGRLRRATAGLHAEIERVADLPGSINTREDYRRLLMAFERACVALTPEQCPSPWRAHWTDVGIEPVGRPQLDLLHADVALLGPRLLGPQRLGPRAARAAVRDGWAAAATCRPDPVSPEEQLGRLYVLEGSALGRRVLAPLLVARLGALPVARLGALPVSFFLDADRHPYGWRALQNALRTLDDDDERQAGVVRGAQNAFEVFRRELSRPFRDLASPVG